MPDQSVPDDAAGLRAANARLRALLAERDSEIAVLRGHLDELTALQAEAGELRERAAGLEAQVADLAARLAQNSRNSSRPPSSDGLAKPAPKSLRGKTGRKPGRPKGQPGATMQFSDHPDRVVRHEPALLLRLRGRPGRRAGGGRDPAAGHGDPRGPGRGHRASDGGPALCLRDRELG